MSPTDRRTFLKASANAMGALGAYSALPAFELVTPPWVPTDTVRLGVAGCGPWGRKILDELDRLGLRDSTAIVFASDHGYHLGEHTFWQKANLHEEVIRVPLIMSIPGYEPGKSESIVELVDIYPTLAEVLGFSIPKDVQGTSLLPVLIDNDAFIKEGALSFQSGASWREDQWSYMLFTDGTDVVYNMEKDPLQFTNQARNPESAADRARLNKKLLDRLNETGISRVVKSNKKK